LSEERVRAFTDAAHGVEYQVDVVVQSLDLMQSELGPGGSKYSTVASAALRSE
jgi:2'-5' RNA ligase